MNHGKRYADVLVVAPSPVEPVKRACLQAPWKPIPRVIASEDIAYTDEPIETGAVAYSSMETGTIVYPPMETGAVVYSPAEMSIPGRFTEPLCARVSGHPICILSDPYPIGLNDEAIGGFNPWTSWRH